MDIPSSQHTAACLILLILLQETVSDYILTWPLPPTQAQPLEAGTRTDVLSVSTTQPT